MSLRPVATALLVMAMIQDRPVLLVSRMMQAVLKPGTESVSAASAELDGDDGWHRVGVVAQHRADEPVEADGRLESFPS